MIAPRSFDAPDLIRGLPATPRCSVPATAPEPFGQHRGPGSSPRLRLRSVHHVLSKREHGVLHLYHGLPLEYGHLYWRHKQPTRTRFAAQTWQGIHTYQEVQHHEACLLRDPRHAGSRDCARTQTQKMAARVERGFNQRHQPKLVRLEHGGLVSLRSRIKSGTA